jgi:hypothetical protein
MTPANSLPSIDLRSFRLYLTCLFLLTVVPAHAAPNPNRPECFLIKPGWTKTEISAWHDLCSTGEANLNDGELNGSFVVSVLSKEPFRTEINSRGLRLRHAHIVNSVDLENATLPYGISIIDSSIDGNLTLSYATVDGSIVLVGTNVRGDINVNSADIKGSLLIGCSAITEPVNKGDLPTVERHTKMGGISARSTHVRGSINVVCADFSGTIFVDSATVEGDINIMYISGFQVSIGSSKISYQLAMISCNLRMPKKYNEDLGNVLVLLLGSHIGESVYLNKSDFKGVVHAEQMDVGHSLGLLGTHLEDLDLREAAIHSILLGHRNRNGDIYDTKWYPGSTLNLSRSNIRGFLAPQDAAFWPDHIRFLNFSIKSFTPQYCSQDRERCPTIQGWFSDWLDKASFDSQAYIQPYHAVYTMLKDQGSLDEANRTEYRGRDRALILAWHEGRWLEVVYFGVLRELVGYGLYPERSILAITFMTLLGAVVFTRTKEARENRMPWGLTYSFDMLLPLIKLRDCHYKIDLRGHARYYFYAHKIIGWILGSFILAALAGLLTP